MTELELKEGNKIRNQIRALVRNIDLIRICKSDIFDYDTDFCINIYRKGVYKEKITVNINNEEREKFYNEIIDSGNAQIKELKRQLSEI